MIFTIGLLRVMLMSWQEIITQNCPYFWQRQGEVTPLNVLVAYVAGRSGMLCSTPDSLHTFQCQSSVFPGHASPTVFPDRNCLMERMHGASIQNRPKGLPYLSLYDKPDISGFGASVVTLKHHCFAFLPCTSHWQNTVLKIILEAGCLFQITADNLGASMSVVWHCLSDVLLYQ